MRYMVKPGSTDGRRSERHQTGAMGSRSARGQTGCLLSVVGAASVPGWGRAVAANRWIRDKAVRTAVVPAALAVVLAASGCSGKDTITDSAPTQGSVTPSVTQSSATTATASSASAASAKLPTTNPATVGNYKLSPITQGLQGQAYMPSGDPTSDDMMVVVPNKTTQATAQSMAKVMIKGTITTTGAALCGTPNEADFTATCVVQYEDGVLMVMATTANVATTGAFTTKYYELTT